MCSIYVPCNLAPEDIRQMAIYSGMYWCADCKKTFMMLKNLGKCPHCSSKRIKPRAK